MHSKVASAGCLAGTTVSKPPRQSIPQAAAEDPDVEQAVPQNRVRPTMERPVKDADQQQSRPENKTRLTLLWADVHGIHHRVGHGEPDSHQSSAH
jgi:hypothetical protein